jgi:hypothetical protein
VRATTHFFRDQEWDFAPHERSPLPGAPATPDHPFARRIGYGAIGVLLGITRLMPPRPAVIRPLFPVLGAFREVEDGLVSVQRLHDEQVAIDDEVATLSETLRLATSRYNDG